MNPWPGLRRLWRDPRARLRFRGRLRRPYWRRRFRSFGDRSVLVAPSWLLNPGRMEIGADVQIHPGAWLAVESGPQPRGRAPLVIGDRVVIRQDATISCAHQIHIDDDVTLAGRVLVIDSDHSWQDGVPSAVGNRLYTDPVHIGRGTLVSEGVCILRGSTIGRFCLVGANSVVRGTFPDFSVIAGSPARVVGSTRSHLPDLPVGDIAAALTEASAPDAEHG